MNVRSVVFFLRAFDVVYFLFSSSSSLFSPTDSCFCCSTSFASSPPSASSSSSSSSLPLLAISLHARDFIHFHQQSLIVSLASFAFLLCPLLSFPVDSFSCILPAPCEAFRFPPSFFVTYFCTSSESVRLLRPSLSSVPIVRTIDRSAFSFPSSLSRFRVFSRIFFQRPRRVDAISRA